MRLLLRSRIKWLLLVFALTILYLLSILPSTETFNANTLFSEKGYGHGVNNNDDDVGGNDNRVHESGYGMTWGQVKKALTFGSSLLRDIKDSPSEKNMQFFRELHSKRITEPQNAELTFNFYVDKNGRVKELGKDEYPRANATLVTLVRNQELEGIVHTIKQIEASWNYKFHYPYTFMNDEKFTQEFMDEIRSHTISDCHFEVIPSSIWNKPDHIDTALEAEKINTLKENNVNYADMESYHNMCRFNSGYFYQLEGLKKFKYYMRFEPFTDYYCSIDYDLFKFMEDNNKTYGFTISLYDNPLTVETLWPTTLNFLKQNPHYVHPNGAFKWLTENVQHPDYNEITGGYSTCHFWSNFEIGDMDFYRGEAYSKWMEALEEAGGFYYERWGDAPVHSVGLGLFADKSKIHWFRDIGYHHSPYKNIPNSDRCNAPEDAEYFGPEVIHDQNCLSNWVKLEMTEEDLQAY